MTSIATALQAGLALGLRTSFHYLLYQITLRTGWARRATPIKSWQSFQTGVAPTDGGQLSPNYFWDPVQWKPPGHLPWSKEAGMHAKEAGRRVLAGEFPLFGSQWASLGFPPDWLSFAPMAGGGSAQPIAADRHWTDYAPDGFEADVKLLWEPSRMAWVFTLGRAYRWSEDETFVDGFWRLFESWQESHQPNAGPHWFSAQEVAFRIIALGFARFCFQPALNSHQQSVIAAAVRAHALRLRPSIAYSRAQRNNHLLTEAVGLLTAGLLFPELAEAERFTRDGYRWLRAGLADQIFDDGGYRQHSVNYGRLALDLGLWAHVLCRHNGLALPAGSLQALVRLAEWLADMVEPGNGHTPNFGPNDGTLLLPLTSCEFRDYRPSIQAARAILGGKAPYPPGPWDELTLWFGTEPMPQQIQKLPARHDHPQAGIYSFGTEGTHGFLRAAHFKSRPGHIDQLHLDVWRGGQNVAMDPGTYLYNGQPPWDNRLVGAAVHNTAMVDGREPMSRAGRFLWLNWSRARLLEKRRSDDGQIDLLLAEHDGYHKAGIRHRRLVVRAGQDLMLVVDDLEGNGTHGVYFPWLLPLADWKFEANELQLDLQGERLVIRAEGEEPISALYSAGSKLAGSQLPQEPPQWGWYSQTYAHKEPALHWVTYLRAPLPFQVRTWWCFGKASPADVELRWQRGVLPNLRTVHLGGSTLRR